MFLPLENKGLYPRAALKYYPLCTGQLAFEFGYSRFFQFCWSRSTTSRSKVGSVIVRGSFWVVKSSLLLRFWSDFSAAWLQFVWLDAMWAKTRKVPLWLCTPSQQYYVTAFILQVVRSYVRRKENSNLKIATKWSKRWRLPTKTASKLPTLENPSQNRH